jgi:hypothetical protein
MEKAPKTTAGGELAFLHPGLEVAEDEVDDLEGDDQRDQCHAAPHRRLE